MKPWERSSLGKAGRTVDKHRWEGEEECPVCKYDRPGTTHPMTCADCGVRRTACTEQACFHYWTYNWPDGSCQELIPLCGDKQPDPANKEMFDIVRICQGCHHCLETDYKGGTGVCHYLAQELAQPPRPEPPSDPHHRRALELRAEALVRHQKAGIKEFRVIVRKPA